MQDKPVVLLFEEAIGFSKLELGSKGYGLVEMVRLGLPVPPGLIIPTYVCRKYYSTGSLPTELLTRLLEKLNIVGEKLGRKFGSLEKPLLVSVRSGAPISMPGMMDTILNLGINDGIASALASETGNKQFAYETYLRFIRNFSKIVLKIPDDELDRLLKRSLKNFNSENFSDFLMEDQENVLRDLVELISEKAGLPFPKDPVDQLKMAVEAVFKSWNNPRAKTYRRIYNIPDDLGTAVIIQAMVFGNLGPKSGTGVCFTRDPSTGEKVLYGEYLMNAQGEDIVSGEKNPKPIEELKKDLPEIYEQLKRVAEVLERHFKDMQDIEFTIQEGKLYILQTRSGKRTIKAAVKIAVDMVKEGLITEKEALERVELEKLVYLLKPSVDPKVDVKPLTKGLNASPGAATGKVVFTVNDAIIYSRKGEPVILVRPETKPEDIQGVAAAAGVLTSRGGMTSHAAVVARALGKPAVTGAEEIQIDLDHELFRVRDVIVKKLDIITIDGNTGNVYIGSVPLVNPEPIPELKELLEWAGKYGKSVKIA
jgi:pyruvate,orthophosphate dikinase